MFKEIAELFRSFFTPASSDSLSSDTTASQDPPVSERKKEPERSRSGKKSGTAARKSRGSGQKASQADAPAPAYRQGLIRAADQFAASLSKDHFLRQQAQMAELEGSPCPYVSFNVQMPVYTSLHPSQKSYYFYWRSRFRKGLYEKTDSGYIRLLCFEIMAGTGWTDPAEGLAMLGSLLAWYGDQFPILRASLCIWYRDFAILHRLPFGEFPAGADPADASSGLLNIYLCSLDAGSPLKLPYEVLEALIDYPLAKSRFWQDGNDSLMREAVTRCTGLADQLLRKKTGKGILETYMPPETSVLMLRMYAGAVAEDAGRTIKVTVRNYQASGLLRDYLTNLARHCENCLRALMKYKGRLREIRLDPETAGLIEAFLKREYNPSARKPQAAKGTAGPPAAGTEASAKANMQLDFDKIRRLRLQSDHVRDILEVNEEDVPDEIRQETVLTAQAKAEKDSFQAVSALEYYEIFSDAGVSAGSGPAGTANSDMADPGVADPGMAAPGAANTDVTGSGADKPDAANVNNINPAAVSTDTSGPADADPEVTALYEALTGLQKEVLGVILEGRDTAEKLRVLAADRLLLPEQLVDELNEKSMEFLGDIIIEGAEDSYVITEEYLSPIRLCYTHSPASGT